MKKIYFTGIALLLIVTGTWFYVNHRLRSNLVDLINRQPDRAYDINFKKLSLSLLSKDILLKHVSITPMNDTAGTAVTAHVTLAELKGVNISDLLTGSSLTIGTLSFVEPEFKLNIRKQKADTGNDHESSLQKLFGDILSRGSIEEFHIRNGSLRATKEEFGDADFLLISNYNLSAKEIMTDSVQLSHQVPFKMGSFSSSVDSVTFRLDEHTIARTGMIAYSSSSNEFIMCNAAIINEKDLVSTSIAKKLQADIIELSFETLRIFGIRADNDLHGLLKVSASNLSISGLEMSDFRNKNLPRPADSNKPMFSGMIDAIPIGLEIDTILIRDAFIQYTELEQGRTHPGSLNLGDMNVRITDLSTIKSRRKSEFRIDLSCTLNGSGQVMSAITVPYGDDRFIMNLIIRNLPANSLTTTTEPLMGIDISSGIIHNMNFTMNANEHTANNYLVMQYEDLKITLNDPEMHKTHQGFISHIANSAIRTNNLPDQKNYTVASYVTTRNKARGPFNFVWNSIKEGMMQIVPAGSTRMIMEMEKKKHQNKKRKRG
jgi:hypothetical protein